MNANVARVIGNAEQQLLVVTARQTTSLSSPTRVLYTGVALTGIWIGVAFASVFSPGLAIAAQVQLALPAMSAWVWGGIASGLVLLAASWSRTSGEVDRSRWQLFGIGNAAVWLIAGLVSVFAHVMAFGNATDSVRIPVPALIAPIFALLVTAFLSVYQAGSSRETTQRRDGAAWEPPAHSIQTKTREGIPVVDDGSATTTGRKEGRALQAISCAK